jgi:hypothetical protein
MRGASEDLKVILTNMETSAYLGVLFVGYGGKTGIG